MLIALSKVAKKFLHGNSGGASVEFVATLPLAFGTLAFVFEIGRLLWAHQIATQGVADAARFLSRAPDLTQTYIDQATNIAKTGQIVGGTAYYPWNETGVAFNVDTSFATFSDADFRVSGQIIEVAATVPLTLGTLQFLGVNNPVFAMRVADQARYYGD